jgi:flagellar basal-body rod protein FlgG
MIESLFRTAQKMSIQLRKFSVVANNLANINTNGFKRDSHFSSLINKTTESSSDPSEKVKQLYVEEVRTDFEQGELFQTNDPFNIAIRGNGFFVMESKEGETYTRDGYFTRNDEGYLVNMNGQRLQGESGSIKVEGYNMEINSQGEIYMDGKYQDTIKIVDFSDRSFLMKKEGNQFYLPPDAPVEVASAEDFSVHQGFLEKSNVNPIEEMIKMITLNRGFESSNKIIRQFDNTLGKSVNEIGKIK